ncbi:MAG TPA: EscU/YscU/HrcU family type III secretion system export apparatus switch protein [Smithellaceae bacterium]|nr:EscU/YscU/HrcU family type III secretion system export apparatus switch protein [Smithellaceae bacterium]
MKKEQEQERIQAAAIKYDSATDAAPKVTASGQGMVAERIIAIAGENGVPIKSDPDLIQVLSKLKVGAEIPEELYRAVAEILAFVYSLNENQRQQNISE